MLLNIDQLEVDKDIVGMMEGVEGERQAFYVEMKMMELENEIGNERIRFVKRENQYLNYPANNPKIVKQSKPRRQERRSKGGRQTKSEYNSIQQTSQIHEAIDQYKRHRNLENKILERIKKQNLKGKKRLEKKIELDNDRYHQARCSFERIMKEIKLSIRSKGEGQLRKRRQGKVFERITRVEMRKRGLKEKVEEEKNMRKKLEDMKRQYHQKLRTLRQETARVKEELKEKQSEDQSMIHQIGLRINEWNEELQALEESKSVSEKMVAEMNHNISNMNNVLKHYEPIKRSQIRCLSLRSQREKARNTLIHYLDEQYQSPNNPHLSPVSLSREQLRQSILKHISLMNIQPTIIDDYEKEYKQLQEVEKERMEIRNKLSREVKMRGFMVDMGGRDVRERVKEEKRRVGCLEVILQEKNRHIGRLRDQLEEVRQSLDQSEVSSQSESITIISLSSDHN